jgi:hypothetical protein
MSNDSQEKDSEKQRFRIAIKPLLIFGIIVLIILIGIFVRIFNGGESSGGIRISVPFGLIAIFISFYIFHEYNRVKKAKREERRDYLNQRRKELLDNAVKPRNKKDDQSA